jgi:hypothetical protein
MHAIWRANLHGVVGNQIVAELVMPYSGLFPLWLLGRATVGQ